MPSKAVKEKNPPYFLAMAAMLRVPVPWSMISDTGNSPSYFTSPKKGLVTLMKICQ
jgi:hypothetical protein